MLHTRVSSHDEQYIKTTLTFIQQRCDEIKDYVHIEAFSFEQLEKFQIGYSVDSDGHSLVTEDEGAWEAGWVVIAYETLCGDPIIIDLNEAGYPVSLLWHGVGNWDNGFYLANSLESFLAILIEIAHFLTEKQVFEGNRAIRNAEWNELLKAIATKDKRAYCESWESLLNPLFELVETYEEEMQTKVQEMKKQGKTISEMAQLLNISPKDVYRYFKNISMNT